MARKKITYPRHAKGFGMPVRLSPEGRKQVGVTPRIQEYVSGFHAKGKLNLARKIVKNITEFKKVALSIKEAKDLWAKRSVEDIINTKKVYIMNRKEAAKTGRAAIMGCTDCAQAVTASLRAIGLNALIVRAGTHTYTKFFYRNKIYIADPVEGKRVMVREMMKSDKRIENMYRTQRAFAEGQSLASIKLKSYKDFFRYKYMPPVKRH